MYVFCLVMFYVVSSISLIEVIQHEGEEAPNSKRQKPMSHRPIEGKDLYNTVRFLGKFGGGGG